jgi:hypothetical protein
MSDRLGQREKTRGGILIFSRRYRRADPFQSEGVRGQETRTLRAPQHFVTAEAPHQPKMVLRSDRKVIPRTSLPAQGAGLDDPVFVGGRDSFGALIRVVDAVAILEEKLELTSDLVDRVGDVVSGHERVYEELEADARTRPPLAP